MAMDLEKGNLSYRADIDGLRAVAVLLVVFFHAGFAAVSGGFIGVDVFFVISGFLITGIIVRELDAGHFSFASFYERRIKRICPALFALLGLCTVAGFFLLVPMDLKYLGRSIAASVGFYANSHFLSQVGYFDGPAIEKPLLHTWSLAVEEQFYLIWPVSVVVLYRTLGPQKLRYAILLLLALSLVASAIRIDDQQSAVFYLLPYRAWELLLGAYLAVAPMPKPPQWAGTLFGAAGISSIFYAAFSFDTATQFPGLNAMFPCAGAALLIASGSQNGFFNKRFLSLSPMQFIGKISYSLYLIHWPLFSFAHLFLDRKLVLGEAIAIVLVSLALSVLSWRYVEIPVRRAKLRFAVLSRWSLAAGVLLILCAVLYHTTDGLPFRVSKNVMIAEMAKQGRAKYKADCRHDPKPPLLREACSIGAQANGQQYDFVIWGDSHAKHLAFAFADQALAQRLSGIVISAGGCPPLIHEPNVYRACAIDHVRTANWLKTQTRLKTVFLAGIWAVYAKNGFLEAQEPTPSNPRGHPGFKDTIDFLKSLNVEVVIVEDVPTFPVNVASCAARARMYGRDDRVCFQLPASQFKQDTLQVSALLKKAAKRFNLRLVSTAGAFCDAELCRAEKDGVILYGDQTHLNPSGARYLGSKVRFPLPAPDSVGETAALSQVGSDGNTPSARPQ